MMGSMIAPKESSSYGKFQWEYDVFLSFRGEDTRKNFTDHLYAALYQKGIVTYRDDPSLEKGENISNELLKAIEKSKYFIVIISTNYASSTWCLEELAKIVEYMKTGQQVAIPIFYKVDPSDVRKQSGSFKSAFAQHEATFKDDMNKVQRWKNGMKEIADLTGWDLLDRHESQFIRDIANDLQIKLGKKLFYAPKNLVGIESRVEDMLLKLCLESNDVRFVGIHGMGGIGKSTLARVVFDEINAQFEGCSFLANIREVSNDHGLVYLQNKLLLDVLGEKDLIGDVIAGAGVIAQRLKHKKVLIVLDDVDHIDHLESLAGKSWFGVGTRIIITTRDKHLLLAHRVDAMYKAKELNKKEALGLFCSKALEENKTMKKFANLAKEVIEYAKGLPLALTVLGSYLLGKTVDEWKDALANLKKCPDEQIYRSLRLSYDGLKETEKKLFLDIACFFHGNDIDYVVEILGNCGFHPKIGVKILIERSLVVIIDNNVMIHDLLREMAWEVVKQESPMEPGKRSRLGNWDDLSHVMVNDSGTRRIEGVILNFGYQHNLVNFDAGCFNKMTNLRLLVIESAFNTFDTRIQYLPNKLHYLSNKLLVLRWVWFPSRYLPTNFLPENLCELCFRHSPLRRLWRSQKVFEKLKHIEISDSGLLETPDFNTIPNLEELILNGCRELSRIHPSIGVLHSLRFLDLHWCRSLRELPSCIGNLKSLRALDLSGCKNLKDLPDSICNLECLEMLDISYSGISYLPSSLANLKNIKKLSYTISKGKQSKPNFWSGLFHKAQNERSMLSSSFPEFSYLECLNLQEGEIPNNLGCLSSLRELNLSYNHFFSIPESINQIPRLETLILNCCVNLQVLPRLPESILYVKADCCEKLHDMSNHFMVCSDSNRGLCLCNCLRLLPENLEIPSTQKYSLALLYYIIGCSVICQFRETYIVAPNYEIPKWFAYQKDGSLLSFCIRDPGFKFKSIGFIICVSFLRQEQEGNNPKIAKCSYDLICGFNVGENQFGHSFHFPIRLITSNCLWMGFVPLECFGYDTKWEEIIDERIDVSMSPLDEQLKVIKCGIFPLQRQRPHTFKKFIQSGSSSTEYVSSIFHELVYKEIDFQFSSSSDNKERRDHREFLRDIERYGIIRGVPCCGINSGWFHPSFIYNTWHTEFCTI